MSVHSYIASFLEKNGYHKTLAAFKEEHSTEIPSISHCNEIDHAIIDKVKTLTISREKPGNCGTTESPWLKEPLIEKNWTNHKVTRNELPKLSGLVIDCALNVSGMAACATATRNLTLIDLPSSQTVFSEMCKSSVVRKVAWSKDILILGYINGLIETARYDPESLKLKTLNSVQAHERLIVDMKTIEHNGSLYIFSLGWDRYLKVFTVDKEGSLLLVTSGPQISSQGICIELLSFKNEVFVMIGKKESSAMDIQCLDTSQSLTHKCQIALSDAEYATTKFSPLCIRAVCANSVPLVAVATSHEPFMRVVLVTLADIDKVHNESILRSQISANFNTMSPQDKYSEACIAWNVDGSGLWIFGDDGIVRCLEVKTGLIVDEREGHEGRVKSMDTCGNQLLTCGIDRRLILWEQQSQTC